MLKSPDNSVALTFFKAKVQKWRNISIVFSILIIALILILVHPEKEESKIDTSKDFIARINISGIIVNDDYRNKILEEIAKKDNVKAVVIHVDSPGGTVIGSEILYNKLRDIYTKKPIVVVMDGLAASGGYMISMASDHIISHNSTLTGSIGVIMQMTEFSELADKVGIGVVTYRSSPLKGQPSPLEKPSKEANEAMQETIRDSYNYFVEIVMERRGLSKEKLRQIADGRVFTGRQALKNGLVDKIGNEKDALEYLKDMHNIKIDKLKIKDISLTEPDYEWAIYKRLKTIFPFNQFMKQDPRLEGVLAIYEYYNKI